MLKCILFDLDNTLYPKSLGIFDLVSERIRGYMETRMGLEKTLVRGLREKYLRQYGSTLRGLMVDYDLDPDDYLAYVHDVGVEEKISPNPALAHILESIPVDKCIFTSGHRPHARKVLHCLGVDRHFPRIFDIVFTKFISKPNPKPYHQVLDSLGIEGPQCMMIEDLTANLKPAKDLGMTTVLVGECPGGINGYVDYEIRDILEIKKVLGMIGMEV